MIPKGQHLFKSVIDLMRTAKACVYGTCFFDRLALAEQKNQLARLAGLEFYRGLNRRTWIESRPIPSGQVDASQGCGLREREAL